MMQYMNASREEAAHLGRRLVGCMPATRFEMQTLTRLASIVATRQVPTASVECTRRPRMLINPDFVAKHCERDEHLFLLVMHELWHVLLAHTRMYPFSTPAHNIAFDAVINSGLMSTFNAPEYRGFFEGIYKADEFPYCLLRPPEGWPYEPVYPEVGPPGTRQIIERLYPRNNYRSHFGQKPMYEEILDLLMRSDMDFNVTPVFLLGDHSDQPRNADGSPMNDPFMKDALKGMMKSWGRMVIDGQGYGGSMGSWKVQVRDEYDKERRTFSNVLKLALGRKTGREYRRAKVKTQSVGGNTPLINSRDRTLAARRALGNQSLLYAQNTEVKARLPERPSIAHIYLDVSGSMSRMLPSLLGLLVPYVAKKQAYIYQFSTKVTSLKLDDLREGQLTTTGGTDINCVLEHMLESDEHVNKVLILTDGAVGSPQGHLATGVVDRNITMHVVLPNRRCNLHYEVQPLARSIVHLG